MAGQGSVTYLKTNKMLALTVRKYSYVRLSVGIAQTLMVFVMKTEEEQNMNNSIISFFREILSEEDGISHCSGNTYKVSSLAEVSSKERNFANNLKKSIMIYDMNYFPDKHTVIGPPLANLRFITKMTTRNSTSLIFTGPITIFHAMSRLPSFELGQYGLTPVRTAHCWPNKDIKINRHWANTACTLDIS